MYEELNPKIEQNDESLPMPESQAVLANELNAGTHPFRIIERKIEHGVKLKGKTGTYTRFEVRARPLDVDLAPGKSLGVFFSYNLKTSAKCGEFIKNQGVTPEYLDGGRVSLSGLVGSCFEAEVVHTESQGVIYSNIDRDTLEHIECTKQGRL